MMDSYDIPIKLPRMLCKTWYGKKRSSNRLKVHIPKSVDNVCINTKIATHTFCGMNLQHPDFPVEYIEAHTVDLENDLCVICLARHIAQRRKQK